MHLRVLVKTSNGTNGEKMVEVCSAEDFSKVERAAAAAARALVRAMPLYGPTRTDIVGLHMEWVPDAPPAPVPHAPAKQPRAGKPKRRK